MQLYEIDIELLSSVFKALSANFSDYVIYNTGNSDILVVASESRDLTVLSDDIFSMPDLQQDLDRVSIKTLGDIHQRRIGNKALLDPLFNSYPAPKNSDYFPFLARAAPEKRYLKKNVVELSGLHLEPFPMLELLDAQGALRKGGEPVADPYFPPVARRISAQALSQLMSRSLQEEEGDQVGAETLETVNYDRVASLSNQLKMAVYYITSQLKSCDVAAINTELWFSSLSQITSETIPFLQPVALTYIDQLREHPCVNSLPEEQIMWIELYQVVAKRDIHAIAVQAHDLLKIYQEILSAEQFVYLFNAVITSYMVLDDTENLRVVWRELSPMLGLIKPQPLSVRLLTTNVLKRIK